MARSLITSRSRSPSDSTFTWAMSLWLSCLKKPAKLSIRGNPRGDLIATIMTMKNIYSKKQQRIIRQKPGNGVPQLASTMCSKYKRHWERRRRMLIFGMIPKPSLKSSRLFLRNASKTTPPESSIWIKVARSCSKRDTQKSCNSYIKCSYKLITPWHTSSRKWSHLSSRKVPRSYRMLSCRRSP